MTIARERTSSITETRDFLLAIVMGNIKRCPLEVKKWARSLIRHYPSRWEFEHYYLLNPDTNPEWEVKDCVSKMR